MPTCGIDRDSELMKGDCPSSFLLKAISPCTNCCSLSGRHRLCAEANQLGWVAGEVPTDEDMNLLVSRDFAPDPSKLIRLSTESVPTRISLDGSRAKSLLTKT